MTNKQDNRLPGLNLDDHGGIEGARLMITGIDVNGAPSPIQAGDELHGLVAVRCDCGTTVGTGIFVDRSHRGAGPIYFVELQRIQDASVRPVVVTPYRAPLPTDVDLTTDCPAHGSRRVDTRALLRRIQKSRGAVVGTRMRFFVAPPAHL